MLVITPRPQRITGENILHALDLFTNLSVNEGKASAATVVRNAVSIYLNEQLEKAKEQQHQRESELPDYTYDDGGE